MKTLRDVYIPKSVVDFIPECIARERAVIAVALHEQELVVACAYESLESFDQQHLPYILNLPVSYIRLPRSEIIDAINRSYVEDGTIDGCAESLRYQCPQRWRDLAPTEDASVRFCNVCNFRVHACDTRERATEYVAAGSRVAIMRGADIT